VEIHPARKHMANEMQKLGRLYGCLYDVRIVIWSITVQGIVERMHENHIDRIV
jgi:hypothetical protein